MLKLQDITVKIDNCNGFCRDIIHDININFEPGKLYAITGPNGGGKTTLAKVIMGINKHCSGSIFLNDKEISNLGVTERAKLGIAYAFQQPPRFKGLTVSDLLKIASPGLEGRDLRIKLREVGLCPEDYLDRDLGPDLSGGEIKRIEIAQVLARNGVISIFDEPEAGVDLWTVQRLISLIIQRYQHNPRSIAIIITHHQNILPICDEIIVIEEGVIKHQGSAEEIWPLIREDILCKMKDQCRGEDCYEL
ncbi:MAG: ABC transporter ATP-binding protein [Syntrophomonadaceae bacterium]|jgi:Fe-S cluster assembly ATP-binding protein